jgi:hypothetical protein
VFLNDLLSPSKSAGFRTLENLLRPFLVWREFSRCFVDGMQKTGVPQLVRRGTLVAFVSCFGIDSEHRWRGGSGAFDLEADSLPVGLADILVGNSIRCASTFQRGRVGKMPGLCRRLFSISQGPVHNNAYYIRCRIYLSAANGFRQAMPDSLRPVCPSASERLKIKFQLRIGRFLSCEPCALIFIRTNFFWRNSC